MPWGRLRWGWACLGGRRGPSRPEGTRRGSGGLRPCGLRGEGQQKAEATSLKAQPKSGGNLPEKTSPAAHPSVRPLASAGSVRALSRGLGTRAAGKQAGSSRPRSSGESKPQRGNLFSLQYFYLKKQP